jgi:cytochrome b-561
MAKSVPLLGEEISFLLLGGHQIDENTLVRFYVLHCMVLPLALGGLVAVHIWRVRKDGGIYIPPEERTHVVRPVQLVPAPDAPAEAATAAEADHD